MSSWWHRSKIFFWCDWGLDDSTVQLTVSGLRGDVSRAENGRHSCRGSCRFYVVEVTARRRQAMLVWTPVRVMIEPRISIVALDAIRQCRRRTPRHVAGRSRRRHEVPTCRHGVHYVELGCRGLQITHRHGRVDREINYEMKEPLCGGWTIRKQQICRGMLKEWSRYVLIRV